MTVTVIRLDTKQGDGFTQYCIVNTEMNLREFNAYWWQTADDVYTTDNPTID